MKKITFLAAFQFCFVFTAQASSAGFCLKKCTEEFCGQSQENYQQCQDSCRGMYEGLIAKCKLVAKKEGYHDEKIKEDAKFSPCLTNQNDDPSTVSDEQPPSNDDKKSDGEKSLDNNEDQKDTPEKESDTAVDTEAKAQGDDEPDNASSSSAADESDSNDKSEASEDSSDETEA
ncbi:MAG: hypothetical protein J0G29_04300 [Alphaproteobacteria bacterium]|nr:hypothetical protein [Alphaproteobacteria bacterium]OJV47563.1 MAG: hypothetical protein BGO28_06935 [Alphaproteobacteria bacterium 43-37]